MKEFIKLHAHNKNFKKRFKNVISFLKKIYLKNCNKKTSFFSLPWYLILGPQNSGKTTLLNNSELKFILQKKIKKSQNPQSTHNYEWWATTHAAIIDTPGKNFDNIINNKNNPHKLFLKLIKKYYHDEAPAGVIIVISLEELMRKQKSMLNNMYKNIYTQLNLLSKTFSSPIPIYLILNKYDCLSGFREYFGDLSREERQQIWGNLLQTKLSSNKKIIDNFNNMFNKLMQRLNEQLTWRLQHETNADKRILINTFPTQIAKVKEIINQLMNQTFRKTNKEYMPCGIFFTSATQEFNHSQQKPKTFTASNYSLINIQPPKNKAYFVHDLFNKHLFAEKPHIVKQNRLTTPNFWLHSIAYLSSILLIFAFSYLCISRFQQQTTTISSAQQIITANKTLSQSKNQLASLYSLQQINLALATNSSSLFSFMANKTINNLKQNITAIYQKKLNALILPKIITTLEKNLRDKSLATSLLYDSLKSYIMLTDATRYDATYLNNHLPEILKISLRDNKQNELLLYLHDLLVNYTPIIKPHKHIITSARKRLKNLEPIELAFIILQSNIPNNQQLSLNLATNPEAASVLTFADKNISIPGIYTIQSFTAIFPQLITKAAHETIAGNWIIGKLHPDAKMNTDTLASQLADKYLTDYANVWVHFLNNIKIINFTQLDSLVNAIKLLSSDNSPLLQLISLVQTNVVPQIATVNDALNKFTAMQTNTTQQNSTAAKITTAMQNLYNYLTPITNATDINKQAFIAASIRMRNNGADDPIENLLANIKEYPEPVRSWLYNLASNAWDLMLTDAETYINSQWQKSIIPQYQAQIADLYPFAATATANVTLTNFSYFFAPNGLIDKFFLDYLSPYIDATQLPWKLKNLDGNALPIYNSTLACLQQAYAIQRIYFDRTNQQPYLAFIVQPINLDNNLENITITLGSQQITYANNQYPAVKFIWPDNTNSNLAQITFTDKNDKQVSLTEKGPWALFKLLQHGNLTKEQDKKYYSLTLNSQSLSAKLAIATQQKTNPFSLALLKNFRLPDSL